MAVRLSTAERSSSVGNRNKTEHKVLYRAAVRSVERIFSDTSVPQEVAVRSLRSLRDEIDLRIKALEAG